MGSPARWNTVINNYKTRCYIVYIYVDIYNSILLIKRGKSWKIGNSEIICKEEWINSKCFVKTVN